MTSALLPVDRRSFRRYKLETSIRYRTAYSPLNAQWKQGRALNMSATGILIDADASFTEDTRLEIAIDWTGLYHGRQAMRLFLIAAVTRTTTAGTALRIVSHRFRDVSTPRVRLQRVQRAVA